MNTSISTEDITAMFDRELIWFLARRYNKPAEEIIHQFLIQNGDIDSTSPQNTSFTLEDNEMVILKAYYNR